LTLDLSPDNTLRVNPGAAWPNKRWPAERFGEVAAFIRDVRGLPVFVLWGSHLIEVLEPERVEVLIDGPISSAHWGGGNLACWFPAGHGVILDSANHFDHQGLEHVIGLKNADDRKAYAMDHMCIDYAEMRQLEREGVWGNQATAAKEVRDTSVFRFITNFVRQKRKADV